MGFEVTDEIKNNGEKTQRGYSILNILLGIIMLVIGLKHLPPTADPAASTISEVSAASEESDPCPNGTAYYLYVAGIILLVANLVGIVTKVAQYLAERDGKISCGEACGLGLLNCASGVLVVAEIVMLFWVRKLCRVTPCYKLVYCRVLLLCLEHGLPGLMIMRSMPLLLRN